MRRFRPRAGTGRRVGDRRKCEAFEVMFHVFTRLLPDRQKNALALVVARPVLMRLAEITQSDRTVDCGDDFGQANVGRGSRQGVPAAHAALRAHESGSFESQEDLFEIGLR